MPNNHVKYHTPGVRLLRGTPVKLKHDHGGTGIEPPVSLIGEAFDHDAVRGQERRHGPGGLARGDARQGYPPVRLLEPQGAWPAWRVGQILNFDHVNPVRQGVVEPVPHVRCGTCDGERDL